MWLQRSGLQVVWRTHRSDPETALAHEHHCLPRSDPWMLGRLPPTALEHGLREGSTLSDGNCWQIRHWVRRSRSPVADGASCVGLRRYLRVVQPAGVARVAWPKARTGRRSPPTRPDFSAVPSCWRYWMAKVPLAMPPQRQQMPGSSRCDAEAGLRPWPVTAILVRSPAGSPRHSATAALLIAEMSKMRQ